MFVNLGILLLTLTRWVNKEWKKAMYLKLVRQVCQQCSVYVRRPLASSDNRLGQLIQSPLVAGCQKFEEDVMLLDDSVTLTAVKPKQLVHLGQWTSYYHPQGVYKPQASGEDVQVLLEATRPANMQSFLERQLQIAPVDKVHVLSHGAAVAWHTGMPFGIILHCSLEEYVTLMMAFVDGCLTMDEDLEVSSILTVDTEGEPENFISLQQSHTKKAFLSSPAKAKPKAISRKKSDSDFTTNASAVGSETMGSANEQMSEQWSNESLASNTSIGKAELLELSDSEIPESENPDEAFLESGAGEDLSEMEFEGSTNSGSLSQSWGLVRMSSISKPPNLLVYTGKIDSVRKFGKVQTMLEQCLNTECYVIYHLKHEDIDQTPWMDNTALLVVQARKVYPDANAAFLKYFQNGGKIFTIGSGFDSTIVGLEPIRSDIWISEISYKSWSNVPLIVGSSAYNVESQTVRDVEVHKLGKDKDGNSIILKVSQLPKLGSGCVILSQVLFDKDAGDLGVTPDFFNTLKKSNATRFEILRHLLTSLGLECSSVTPPKLTPAVLITKDKALQTQFMKSIEKRLSSGMLKTVGSQSLLFMADRNAETTETVLPVITADGEPAITSDGEPDCPNFSAQVYRENLRSRVLGNTVIYTDVVPTTMTLLDGLLFSVPEDTGLIAIARQQTSGKGRGGNSWLSPVGCAMFTLHVRVPLDSTLGKSVSFLQHITSLAVVYSVVKLPGHQDIDLRLKWPNDIYYGSMMKLGGVIVKSTIMDGVVHATIGCGFNVSNSNPTICINDLIQLHNRQVGEDLEVCSTEQLIGRTVTYIEQLIEQFQTEGSDSFKQLYYDKWLHSNSKVTLQSEDNMEVTIVGLDDYGYLLVKSQQGEVISVQPDGNSFDMMQNLISFKTR